MPVPHNRSDRLNINGAVSFRDDYSQEKVQKTFVWVKWRLIRTEITTWTFFPLVSQYACYPWNYLPSIVQNLFSNIIFHMLWFHILCCFCQKRVYFCPVNSFNAKSFHWCARRVTNCELQRKWMFLVYWKHFTRNLGYNVSQSITGMKTKDR